MVALGAIFSAIWIVVANSWQQTPAGFHIVGEGLRARAEITDFWAMVFNPSSMHRLTHTLIGAYILGGVLRDEHRRRTTCLKGRHLEFAKKSFTIALIVGTVMSLAAACLGPLRRARRSRTRSRPSSRRWKAHFDTHRRADAAVPRLADPDEKRAACKHGVAIPGC